MPDPPTVSRLAHHLFENPWPTVLGLAAIGAVLLWRGLRDERRGLLIAGAVALLAALANLGAGFAVTTSGEHARRTVREFVEAVESGRIGDARMIVAEDATFSFERPENPSLPRDVIDRGLSALEGRHAVEDNSTTRLRGYSTRRDEGIVHLALWTRTASSMGTVPSQWVIRVDRQADGGWRIARITCVSIAGRSPVGAW